MLKQLYSNNIRSVNLVENQPQHFTFMSIKNSDSESFTNILIQFLKYQSTEKEMCGILLLTITLQ